MSRRGAPPHSWRAPFPWESILPRIRIMVAAMSRMMREIVETAVRSEPDMHFVGAVESDDALPDVVAQTGADVLIVGLASAVELRAYDGLLYRNPRLHLLAIIDDGRGALLYELRPHQVRIGDVSPSGLVDAIRASASAQAI